MYGCFRCIVTDCPLVAHYDPACDNPDPVRHCAGDFLRGLRNNQRRPDDLGRAALLHARRLWDGPR